MTSFVSAEPTVTIVDDDEAFGESLAALVTSLGVKSHVFNSADAFLKAFDPLEHGCVIIDVRMPQMSGLALQERLAKEPIPPSIVFLTAYAEVPAALRAMRLGAVDFLLKTASEAEIIEAIQRAIAADSANRAAVARRQQLAASFALLSAPETQVLKLVLDGTANKAIASTLGVSCRTVEDRRARIMQKLRVETLAELVRLAIEAGIHD